MANTPRTNRLSFDVRAIVPTEDEILRTATARVDEMLRTARKWPDFHRYEARMTELLKIVPYRYWPITLQTLRRVYLAARRQQRILDRTNG